MITRYQLREPAPADWLKQVPELHPAIATLVYHAGIRSVDAADRFLHPTYERDQHDPFLFRDMTKAVERIIAARDRNERVLIYGDYDADGVCATVLLYDALRQNGVQQLSMYLPHRDTEGYGLNQKAIAQFIHDKIQLLITVDCGISNAGEVAYAKEHGLDVIVTDHHVEPPTLPHAAYAILNPQLKDSGYPWPMLAGVGVAFKLAQALGRTLHHPPGYEKWLLDLVAISTVTDCMPLIDENRTLVKYGLVVLNKTRRLGIQKLIAATHKTGTPVTTSTISYRIGPWINAAGRIDHANVAVKLLQSDTDAVADQHVQTLAATNTERQAQTEQMFREANEQAKQQPDQPVLAVYGEHWPLGLIGLVAGKLVSEHHKPAFVMTDNQGLVYGSGRSVPGVNLIKTVQQIDQLFERYGGHAMACGFSLKSSTPRSAFVEAFVAAAHESLSNLPSEKIVPLAAELSLADLTWQFIEQLEWLEPFGEQHPEPLFCLRHVILKDFQAVGNRGQHVRVLLGDDSGRTVKAIAFGMGKRAEQFQLGDRVSPVGTVGVNQWNGHRDIQFQIKDLL